MTEAAKPERLARTVVYENPWVNLYIDRVRFPAGRIIEAHHILEFEREAVAVVAENSDQDILLIRAYRYATDSIEWEVPGGGIDAGEDALTAGLREVLEETGYESRDPVLLHSYFPMNGIANQVFHVVKATTGAQIAEFDENEVASCRWVSPDEIRLMIRRGEIRDGFSLTALLIHLSGLHG